MKIKLYIMDLVERVKNWWKGSPSIEAKDMVEFRQGKIDILKGQISDIIDDIDLNEQNHLAMTSATDEQIEKGMADGDSLKDHLELKYNVRNDKLVKSLSERKGDLRRHENKLNEIINDDLEKAKKAKMYADAIVKDSKGNILMLLRTGDGDFEPNTWGLPGGNVDPGEDYKDAVIRELSEETGLIAKNCYKNTLAKWKDGSSTCFYDVYIDSKDTDAATAVISLDQEEHQNYTWMSMNEVKSRPGSDFIINLRETLIEIIEPKEMHYNVIKKGYESGMIDEKTFSEAMSTQDRFKYAKEEK